MSGARASRSTKTGSNAAWANFHFRNACSASGVVFPDGRVRHFFGSRTFSMHSGPQNHADTISRLVASSDSSTGDPTTGLVVAAVGVSAVTVEAREQMRSRRVSAINRRGSAGGNRSLSESLGRGCRTVIPVRRHRVRKRWQIWSLSVPLNFATYENKSCPGH